jgi:hypothetical protein
VSFWSWTLTHDFQDERCLFQGEWVIHVLWRITSRSQQIHPRARHAEDDLETDIKEWLVKTDRYLFMCTILLFKDCSYNAIYRWSKELGNIRPKTFIYSKAHSKLIKDSPHQLQLTKANIATLVIVSNRSKFDVFRFLDFFKPEFGCLVKTTHDMLQIIEKRWISQVF